MISWSLGAAFAGGLVLGLVNFSLLFATTARLLEAKRPMMLATGSFLGRVAVITACLYLLAGGHGGKLVAPTSWAVLPREAALSSRREAKS